MIVARGIVFSGSLTSSAGTVADSSPMNAHSASVAAALTCQSNPPCAGANGVKFAPWMKKSPMMPITASGTNLTTVVITCAQPVSRTPMMFTIVNSQIAPTATSAASQLDVLAPPQNTPR